eukprot:jgi/Tetstr1/461019/TSEL_006169.t1
MVVQRHFSPAIRLRDFVALALGFQRIAATEAEHKKLAADRASSAPVQGVHRYYPFVVEDRGLLGKSALTVVYIFAVLLDRGQAEIGGHARDMASRRAGAPPSEAMETVCTCRSRHAGGVAGGRMVDATWSCRR